MPSRALGAFSGFFSQRGRTQERTTGRRRRSVTPERR